MIAFVFVIFEKLTNLLSESLINGSYDEVKRLLETISSDADVSTIPDWSISGQIYLCYFNLQDKVSSFKKVFFWWFFLQSPFSNKQRVRLKNKIIFSPGWFRTEWRRCDRVVHERSQAALLQGQPDSVRKFRWQAGKVWWVSFLQNLNLCL